ncbi:putative membrane protein [Diaminobutyricimonas aerilata]|uniref:Putative membrane protein n=1 Tax=Diaminobutyricimonas aerilata TaxID=1162967 RepID=A0A2M9CLP8_9MICO|nr:cytochrome c oxidase assembly protein [Diaminobutyricimonas aerilata]PJJ72809.1 putative membrane protein [Diaminobutyricimonas aerilata]
MHAHPAAPGALTALLVGLAAVAVVAYLAAAVRSTRSGRGWPVVRSACWVGGCAALAAPALLGASGSPGGFVEHMREHVLVGMVAPTLLALARPATLALRTLSPVPARRLARVLGSRPVAVVAHPVVAGALTAVPLWLLYTTPLGTIVLSDAVLHTLLLGHFVAAGYLLAGSTLELEPTRHPHPALLRGAVLVATAAAHAALAKWIAVHPPAGVAPGEALEGARLMWTVGDGVELVLLAVFFVRWTRSRARVRALTA